MALSEHPGMVVSGVAHGALLLAAVLSFSSSAKFADAQETIPVEMLSNDQFNQIMKGEKTAKEIKPTQKAEKLAQIAEPKPLPPLAEAKRDIPVPPPPLKRQPDPGDDDKPEPQKPPERTAAVPPPRPALEPPKPEPRPEPVKPAPPPVAQKAPPPEEAEALEPKPPPRPKIEPKPEAKPTPEPKPRVAEKPKDEPPKKVEPQFKPDQVAKLLEQDKQKTPPPKPIDKPAVKPKSGDETAEAHKFDPGDISRLLSKEAPQRKAATGHELMQVAALGSPTASAPKMSPSLMAQIDGFLLDKYRECWAYTPLGSAPAYVAQIRIHYQSDGSLAAEPQLINPTGDTAQKIVAEAALRAVRRCNPLRVPAQYEAYYDYWKSRVIGFNPNDM